MTQSFTVVSANLHLGRKDLDALHRWVDSISADVFVLQEVNGEAAETIKQWQDYPYQLVTPEEGPFGLAVLSRHPLGDTEALESIEQPLRHRTFVGWQDKQIALSAIHPMPPISPL
ncbi:endonuclease/exonuclease/phosphatase family protein [Rhodocyclaceae bacterium SMB388]